MCKAVVNEDPNAKVGMSVYLTHAHVCYMNT